MKEFGDDNCILIRESGMEPAVRVMAEAEDSCIRNAVK